MSDQDPATPGIQTKVFNNPGDFVAHVDLAAWDMATACGSCHVGGSLVEMDRNFVRHSMRPKDLTGQSFNMMDNFVAEYFTPGQGQPAHFVNDRCMNSPFNHDGTPVVAGIAVSFDGETTACTTAVPDDADPSSLGFAPAMAAWAMPATFDNRFTAADGGNAVVPSALYPGTQGWAPAEYVQMGMAVEGQMLMPNVREMDCFMCHLTGYNNIINSVATQMGYLNASPALSSGLMNMFSQTYMPGTTEAAGPEWPGFGVPVKLSGSFLARLKAEPPTDNCRQCHIPTNMANFSDMFDQFLAASPMEYNPTAPYGSLITGMAMPGYDLNSPFVPPTGTSPEVSFDFYGMSWVYGDGSSAAGPFGIFPMALDSSWSMFDASGNPNMGVVAGGGKAGETGPLFYAGGATNDQNALKKATIPFPRADFFKRGDIWDNSEQEVHYRLGCGGCHFNTNSTNANLVQCDPGRGQTRMGGVESGKGPNHIDTRSTVKRCRDCHITGTNVEGIAIDTYGAPNPTAAHTAAGLTAKVATAIAWNGTAEVEVPGDHLDVVDCSVCHIYKKSMTVRSLDSTSGNRYPAMLGYEEQNGMLAMFTDPMDAANMDDATAIMAVTGIMMKKGYTQEEVDGMLAMYAGQMGVSEADVARSFLTFELQEWQPIYGWHANEPKTLPDGSVNENWRRKIIPINFIVAQMWDDSANPDVDANGDEGESLGLSVAWDPWIQRDMKAGMNFAAGPFGTIPVGFGGGAFKSAYNADFTFTGAFQYVGVYGGNIVLTTPEEIAAYKTHRGTDWAGTELVFFGGNPFQVTHNVVATSQHVLGEPKADGSLGCDECHSAASGFFSGHYDMTGSAIPASNAFDYGGANGAVTDNMFTRPVVDYEVTAYKDDLRTGAEAKSKADGVVHEIEFQECLAADGSTLVGCEDAAAVYKRTTDLDKAEMLYPTLDAASLAARIAALEAIGASGGAVLGIGVDPVAAIAIAPGSTWKKDEVTAGNSITIDTDAQTGGGSFTYTWTYPNDAYDPSVDGSTPTLSASGSSLTVTFTKAGTKRIELMVVDEEGKVDRDVAYIVVKAPERGTGNIAYAAPTLTLTDPATNAGTYDLIKVFWGDGSVDIYRGADLAGSGNETFDHTYLAGQQKITVLFYNTAVASNYAVDRWVLNP